MMSTSIRLVLMLLACGVAARPAAAQSPSAAPTLLFTGGYAAFVDERRIDHGVVGGGVSWVPWRHMAVGPEVLYMVGPDADRDLFVLGMARFGVVPFERPVVPFVTVGGGLMRHSSGYYSSATGEVLVFGGGVRISPTPRVFIAPELTLGWEPHLRMSVTVGVNLGQ